MQNWISTHYTEKNKQTKKDIREQGIYILHWFCPQHSCFPHLTLIFQILLLLDESLLKV